MKIHIARSAEEWNKIAADIVEEVMRSKDEPVLGLPTGNTPIGMYKELVRRHREEGLDFSRVRTFNLDEYLGIAVDHPGSYHTYMREHLFDLVNIDPERTHLPHPNPESPEEEAARYSRLLEQYGPCDLQVLGIGTNGHIGFNEPGTSFDSKTSVVQLAESTLQANAPVFGTDPETMPQKAITMGIAEIMTARKILLLANGASKAAIMKQALEGPVTENVPASVLQRHPNVVVLLDEAAASELSRRS